MEVFKPTIEKYIMTIQPSQKFYPNTQIRREVMQNSSEMFKFPLEIGEILNRHPLQFD